MGKSRKANRDVYDTEFTDGEFELDAEDRWEDTPAGRFAKARWSEGPARRRSDWLRRRLEEARAGVDDELGYVDLRA